MSRRLVAFGRFWYDFIVGDDWVIAAGVVLALLGVHLLARAGINAWWSMPVAVVVLLAISLWRLTRPSKASGGAYRGVTPPVAVTLVPARSLTS